jgi:hypothetical protein
LNISKNDIQDLRYAKKLLENPNFLVTLSHYIGEPIELGLNALPEKLRTQINEKVRVLLQRALHLSVTTMGDNGSFLQSEWAHKTGAGVLGAVGGVFGIKGALIELPFTTTLLLRAIGAIALEQGEDLNRLESRLACLEVFALGSPASDLDDAAESGYYAVRIALAKAINKAAAHIAAKGLGEESAPVILRLITKIASRFSIVVTEKLAAKAVPVIGAIGGSTVNVLFMNHFQNMATGHFIVRRLERKYGKEPVEKEYNSIYLE